ncbi:putative histone deacetylase A [Annulohypoxylon truncatum]|uniref:putative histone deacetylase A n=1 Tax=Annulohypoxylon truncatum TaxID=327061 RepID=UPI002007F4C4|nr:putative histone deacetylase A [Annulohypoxylon truncatum]KAI1210513.1 putative histone deacetylase A [Annulohypoxylon truncatum]
MEGEDQAMTDAPNGLDESHAVPVPEQEAADTSVSNGMNVDTNESDSSEGSIDTEDLIRSMRRRGLLPTGCCYDDRMKLHANADFGPSPHHPEDPRRIEEIMKIFKKGGLVFTGPDSKLLDILKDNPTKYMWRIPARPATKQEICTVHTPRHYDWVQNLSEMSTRDLRVLSHSLDQGRASLYVGGMSYEAALLAAGGAVETCKNVAAGKVKNAFAIIRPPGHHAEFDTPMGFCLFNNVPIGAKVCQNEYPDTCRKILILDWDVHHGNGVQNMFYEDPNILYISLHVYANGDFYPGKPDNPMIPDGDIDKVGEGPGRGKNVNIAWPSQGMGDGEYLAAFQKIVMPIAHEFNPDMVIISAGFDAADGDELGGCFVTPPCYAHMTHMLMSLAGGKVAVCLEGGYNLKAISHSALAVARTLMGEPPPKMDIPPINREAAKLLVKVQAAQAPYWECMRPGIIDVRELGDKASRLHDVIRGYQRQVLSEKYSMIPLFIQREVLYKSFENQVLVTPGLEAKTRVIFIIHDPPELKVMPDLVDNTVDPHNGFIMDGVLSYIDWAHKNHFGIVDVNIPHYITHTEDLDAYTPRADEKTLQRQIQELVCYIWDNYLQLYDWDQLFLVGVGNAYLGVKVLLTNRDCKDRITGVINFVTGNLRPVKSETDTELSSWYKQNSLVYVTNDHACWGDADLAKKVLKKRFGGVQRSPQVGLNRMMEAHATEVYQFIRDKVEQAQSGNTTEEEK